MNDECWWVLLTDGQTDEQTDICIVESLSRLKIFFTSLFFFPLDFDSLPSGGRDLTFFFVLFPMFVDLRQSHLRLHIGDMFTLRTVHHDTKHTTDPPSPQPTLGKLKPTKINSRSMNYLWISWGLNPANQANKLGKMCFTTAVQMRDNNLMHLWMR